MRKMTSLLAAVFLLPAVVPAGDGWVHPFDFPQGSEAPAELYALIEIPAGSFTKYEIDEDTGMLVVDRFQSMSVVYPANYGSIPQSLAGDDDPLDVLVLSRAPIHPGAFVKVRPVGILKMLDDGDLDDKVLAVPASKIDPTYDGVRDITDVSTIEKERIAAFFRVYKQLPAGRKKIELKGWADAAAARAMLQAAFDRYKSEHAPAEAAP